MEETKRKQLAELLSSLRNDIKNEFVLNELALQTNGEVTTSTFINSAVVDEELRTHLQQAKDQYHTARWIPDRRFPLGRPLLKKVLYRLLGFYTARQTNFNSLVVRILNSLVEKISHIDRKVEDLKSLTERMNRDMDERFSAMGLTQHRLVTKIKADLESRVKELTRTDPLGESLAINPLESSGREPAHKAKVESSPSMSSLGHNYFCFADKFRGEEREIKNRFAAHLEYFRRCKNLLELGCGRGEFLELCAENNIQAIGIDANEDMVLYCQRKGLQAKKAHALPYLRSLPDKSLDGIFMAYMVEHLPPMELVEVLKLAYEKLQFGSHFVIEAINPACLFTLANNFYLDLLYIKPVHPQAFEFLLESQGFRNIKVEYISPVSDEARLQELNSTSNGPDPTQQQHIEIYNRNIEKLNNLLFGHQSYAIVAKK